MDVSEDLLKEAIIEKQHNKGKGIMKIYAQKGQCMYTKEISKASLFYVVL